MDFHYNKPQFGDGILDFHRFVLLVTHRFSDRLRFVGELELEHAVVEGLEEAGEPELEQAYVDFLLTRAFNVRAVRWPRSASSMSVTSRPCSMGSSGRSWTPSSSRPRGSMPAPACTARSDAAGVIALRDGAPRFDEFDADEGIRGGRQKERSQCRTRGPHWPRRIRRPSWSDRRSELLVGPIRIRIPARLRRPGPRRGSRRPLLARPPRARAQHAQVSIDNADQLNDLGLLRTGVSPNVARQLRGFYVEGGYWAVSGARFGELGVFTRYENVDTQFRMPAGYVPLKEFDRDAWVMGHDALARSGRGDQGRLHDSCNQSPFAARTCSAPGSGGGSDAPFTFPA